MGGVGGKAASKEEGVKSRSRIGQSMKGVGREERRRERRRKW